MSIENPKKISGVKFLKLDQPLFQNIKRLSSQGSAKNDSSLNNKLGSIKGIVLKSSLIDKENQNPLQNSNLINKQFKKYNSFNKSNIIKHNELLLIKNANKLKKEVELPISKLDNIINQNRILYRKSASTKNIKILKNKNMSKKSLFFFNNIPNNINSNNKNKIKINSSKNKKIDDINKIIKPKKEKNNSIKNQKKKNNVNCSNNEKIIKGKTDDTNQENGNKENNKKSKLKKIFCCL